MSGIPLVDSLCHKQVTFYNDNVAMAISVASGNLPWLQGLPAQDSVHVLMIGASGNSDTGAFAAARLLPQPYRSITTNTRSNGGQPGVMASHGAVRILIIDDDAGLRGALHAIFVGNPRYTVQAATDGHDGLAKIGTFRPHLVLLDLRVPGFDDADLCRAVKADPATAATRILAMSALPEHEARERMVAAGADAFLAKPFTLTQLEIEVARLL